MIIKKKNLTKYFTTSAIRLKEPEYACLLSHLETIRIFSKTNYENALILEDDLSIEYKKYWTKTLKEIIDDAPKDWEIIKLFSSYKCLHNNLYTVWDKTFTSGYDRNNLLRNNADWSTISYVINNKSAKKFIQEIYHNKKYVLRDTYKGDVLLHFADYLIYKMLKTYVYKYPLFSIRKKHDTYIQNYKISLKEAKKINKTRKNLLKIREKILKTHKNKYNKTIKNN